MTNPTQSRKTSPSQLTTTQLHEITELEEQRKTKRELWHWAIAGWSITGLYLGPLAGLLASWIVGDFNPLWILPSAVLGPTVFGGIALLFGKSNSWVMATGLKLVAWNTILMVLVCLTMSIAKLAFSFFR